MSIERKASTQYAQNASTDAKTVNHIFGFFRLLWASVFFITGYILYLENINQIASLVLVANGLFSFRFVQNIFFKSYGFGKFVLQYIALIGSLIMLLA